MNKIFLDTNIILDILSPKRPNHKYHKDLIQKLFEYEVFISEDMLSTIYYIVREKQQVLDFLSIILQEWNIVSFGEDVIKQAIKYVRQNGGDLEDALQCFCAKRYGCDILLTSDKKFVNCGIELLSYDEFLT